jgi:VanZ family protein
MQLGAMIVLTFAGVEEISQYWLPSRTCDIFDFVADTVGVTLFSLWRSK